MSNCWWCYWGWPQPIANIYRDALEKLEQYDSPLLFGPSHVVWSDENWNSAQWCLDNFEDYRGDYSDKELTIVRESLALLIAVPDEYKYPPEMYDDKNPENFPPPSSWVMVKIR